MMIVALGRHELAGEWHIHTWRAKKAVPAMVKEDKEAVVVELGRWKVGILKGRL